MLVYVSYVHRDLETAMSGKDTGCAPACACCCTHAMGVRNKGVKLPLVCDCACAGGFYGAIWKYAGIILIAAPLFAATDFVEMRLVLVRILEECLCWLACCIDSLTSRNAIFLTGSSLFKQFNVWSRSGGAG